MAALLLFLVVILIGYNDEFEGRIFEFVLFKSNGFLRHALLNRAAGSVAPLQYSAVHSTAAGSSAACRKRRQLLGPRGLSAPNLNDHPRKSVTSWMIP